MSGAGAAARPPRFALDESVLFVAEDGEEYEVFILEVHGDRVRLGYDGDRLGTWDTDWMPAASDDLTGIDGAAKAKRVCKAWLRDNKESVAARLEKALPADVERGTVPGLKAALEEFRGARYLAPFGALRDDGRAAGAVSEYQIFRAWAAFLESGTFRKKHRDKPLGPLPRGRSSSRDSSPERGGGKRPRALDRSPEGRTRSASRDPFTPAWVRMSATDACDEFALSREDMLARSPLSLLYP